MEKSQPILSSFEEVFENNNLVHRQSKNRLTRMLSGVGWGADALEYWLSRECKGDYSLIRGKHKSSQLANLLNRVYPRGNHSHIKRSSARLHLRYAEKSENNYISLSGYKGGELKLLAALRIRTMRWDQVNVSRNHLVEFYGLNLSPLSTVLFEVLNQA